MNSKQKVYRENAAIMVIFFALWEIIILAIYGGIRLWDRSDRILQKQVYINTIEE